MSDHSFMSARDVISRLSFGLAEGEPQQRSSSSPRTICDNNNNNNNRNKELASNETTLRKKIVPAVIKDGDVTDKPTLETLLQQHIPSTSSSSSAVARICSEDVSALILSHLSLSEIATVSETCKVFYQACRSNQLWKTLFSYRWNVGDTEPVAADVDWSDGSYFAAYQRAHWYPHDLWVTHWNVVYPAEGLSPGRCCIRPLKRTTRKAFGGGVKVQCPTCRDYHGKEEEAPPLLDDTNDKTTEKSGNNPPRTAAQATAQRTHRLRQRLAAHGISEDVPDPCAPHQERTAKEAFRAAATFHRDLDTAQYRVSNSSSIATNFLTDLVFFNLTDPTTAEGTWELEQLLNEAMETPPANHGTGSLQHATSHHSWHIIELRNSDLYRPILYQFGVQRPDCFAVYPSEGLIEPGQSVHVTISVTPLGSALAYAFEGLDIQRDGLAGEWASLYTAEAHLPLSPFLIRYRFADGPTGPALDARQRRYVVSTEAADSKEATLEHHFQQDFAPHHFRNIYLSAHVNAHYNFWEFLGRTCQPWIIERRRRQGPIWVAPIMAEKYPRQWRLLDESAQKNLPSFWTEKYTEGPCEGCGLIWGARDEELMFEYFAAFAMVLWYRKQRKILLQNIKMCIEVIPTVADRNEEALSILLYNVCCIIQSFKASILIDEEQRQHFANQEVVVDELCRHIRVGGETWIPWRLSGVYRYIRCTDSVFGGQVIHPLGTAEPAYLDAFRHLTHCPGSFCLGRQVDPNHVTSAVQPSSRRFIQKQGNPVSDIFMDDPISALQAGICMLQDPRSLLLHGVYDRIRYPGSVVRRPRMNAPHLLANDGIDASMTPLASYGLLQFVHDVPPPGVGRYAISTVNFQDPDPRPEIVEVKLEDDDDPQGSSASNEAAAPEAPRAPPLRPRPVPIRRGPRFIQMLWTLGASLGLVVIDSSNVSSVFVDRTILIATHWISISLMIAPLLITLTARYAKWIPAQPVDYNLDGLPFPLHEEMRFLSERECGVSAVVLLLVWMALGRWSERHTYRDLFRAMLDHLVPAEPEKSFLRRRYASTKLWLLRRWDGFCPLFLQRRVFSPHWNIRSKTDLIRHLAFWRSRNLQQHRSHTSPRAGQQDCFFGDDRDRGIDFGLDSSGRKVATGIIVVLASFCASSPHFWLNLTTVFSSSVSLGISISVQSLEQGRPQVSVTTNTGSFLRELNLLTVFIAAFLIGQLVGSSGGTMFLAEFVVTSVSLVLGGAGTVSASAMESWFTFSILAWTAFWGYLFGRVGLIDGIILKRRGYSTVLLSSSVALLGIFWTLVLLVGRFDSPVNLVILRPTVEETQKWSKSYAAKMLQ